MGLRSPCISLHFSNLNKVVCSGKPFMIRPLSTFMIVINIFTDNGNFILNISKSK